MKPYTILIVEDEPKLAEVVEAYLIKQGYQTLTARDGRQALKLLEQEPDMVILDLMLPYVSGEEICQTIRIKSRIPIIMLTAKASEDNKIDGLNMGADDYITKPFSPRELVARVNSLFRRYGKDTTPPSSMTSWNDADLTADFETRSVKKQGFAVNLTQSEFNLFSIMAKRPSKIFTREELIELALGADFDGYDRTIDSHIKNLRSKIETDTTNPLYILTVRGIGYKFGGT